MLCVVVVTNLGKCPDRCIKVESFVFESQWKHRVPTPLRLAMVIVRSNRTQLVAVPVARRSEGLAAPACCYSDRTGTGSPGLGREIATASIARNWGPFRVYSTISEMRNRGCCSRTKIATYGDCDAPSTFDARAATCSERYQSGGETKTKREMKGASVGSHHLQQWHSD